MKTELHPKYHPVIFVDGQTGDEIRTRSTLTSKERRTVDGVEYHVIRLEMTSFSHPYFTGTQKLLDTAGRVEKFQKRFASTGGKTVVRKTKAPARKTTTPKVRVKHKVLTTAPTGKGDRPKPKDKAKGK